jgi:hypothetical protein
VMVPGLWSAGARQDKEGMWASTATRGLVAILRAVDPEVNKVSTTLGHLLMPHSLFVDKQRTPLVNDIIRVSAKDGLGREIHEYHRLVSADRTGKKISMCEWEEVDHNEWRLAGGWEVVGDEEEEEDDDDDQEEEEDEDEEEEKDGDDDVEM